MKGRLMKKCVFPAGKYARETQNEIVERSLQEDWERVMEEAWPGRTSAYIHDIVIRAVPPDCTCRLRVWPSLLSTQIVRTYTALVEYINVVKLTAPMNRLSGYHYIIQGYCCPIRFAGRLSWPRPFRFHSPPSNLS